MKRLIFILLILLLSACAVQEGTPVTEVVRLFQTATTEPTASPKFSATASNTPSPTATPTSTPSPTPTAPAAVIWGNPRGFQLLNPTPVYGAPCGLVDTFDFPLDPPDGEEATGRFGFGSYSNRYDKYHAGEDWGLRNGSNFGEDVHSIGHGQVTYAAPNGWGLDKGTVVIRHVFPWGGYVLSFYGHLDPPSVELKTGDCVRRGEVIGEIGHPRTPPHLHFELRYHLPSSPGHGYWSTDPAKSGWLDPSQTVWETRLKASPGVLWTQSYAEGLALSLGTYQDSVLLIQGEIMKAVDVLDGDITWQQTISKTIRNAMLDGTAAGAKNAAPVAADQFEGEKLYLYDLTGDLTAYYLDNLDEPLWKSEVNGSSRATLIPLPGGGVLVADRRRLVAVSADGEPLWENELQSNPVSWVHYEDQIILAVEDGVWTIDRSGAEPWDTPLTGILAQAGEHLYLYAKDGVYRLETVDRSGDRMMELTDAYLEMGSIAATRESGLLLVHVDGYDRRLLLLDPEGQLMWERSLMALPRGQWQLSSTDAELYLLASHSSSSGSLADVYAVDLETGELTHILRGGSRRSYRSNTWLQPLGDGLWLLNVGGGPMGAFNLSQAYQRVNTP